MKTLTTVYSSPCVEALENLITCIGETFGIPSMELKNLFYYGVFCKPETYANYTQYVNELPPNVDFPSILTNPCSTADDRLDYVNGLIDEIIRAETVRVEIPAEYDPCTGELISEARVEYQTPEKPEWMVFVEEDYEQNLCSASPSTFLYLIPKDDDYGELGERLIEFLYSVNKMTTLL